MRRNIYIGKLKVGTIDGKGEVRIAPAQAQRMCIRWTAAPSSDEAKQWLSGIVPENGMAEVWKHDTVRALHAARLYGTGGDAAQQIWAHPEHEYAGALSCSERVEPPRYETRSNEELTRMLRARSQASPNWALIRATEGLRSRSALAGMRAKIGACLEAGNRWRIPVLGSGALTTHIIKVEEHAGTGYPAESAVQATVCRSFAEAGIAAAPTRADVIGELECVISTRTDRVTTETGTIAIHQEDWCQVAGLAPTQRDDWIAGADWTDLDQVLLEHATDAEAQRSRLVEILALSYLLGHADLHRKNIGLQHDVSEGTPRVRIAPLYDASTNDGLPRDSDMRLPVNGQHHWSRIKQEDWKAYARATGQNGGRVLDLVRECAQRIGNAVERAIERSLAEDRVRKPRTLERRHQALLASTFHRAREWQRALRKTQARGMDTGEPRSRVRDARELVRAAELLENLATKGHEPTGPGADLPKWRITHGRYERTRPATAIAREAVEALGEHARQRGADDDQIRAWLRDQATRWREEAEIQPLQFAANFATQQAARLHRKKAETVTTLPPYESLGHELCQACVPQGNLTKEAQAEHWEKVGELCTTQIAAAASRAERAARQLEEEVPRALEWNGDIKDPSLWVKTPWWTKHASMEATMAESAAFFTANAYLTQSMMPSEAVATALEHRARALRTEATTRHDHTVADIANQQSNVWVWTVA